MQAFPLGPLDASRPLLLPYIDPPVPAGAPGPPDHYREKRLDLNDLLLEHPTDTYLWRAAGDCMDPAIQHGDYLVIDRNAAPHEGDVVVALVGGQHTVKRLARQGGGYCLLPDNPGHPPIPIDPEDGIVFCGVVLYAIHPLRGAHEVRHSARRLQ